MTLMTRSLKPAPAVSPVVLCVAVGIGSAVGALCRFETGSVIMAAWGAGDLLTTATVNILGSFIIMLFATLTAPGGRLPMGEVARQFVMAGFCGGYTTRSLMSLSTFILILEHHWFYGAAYVCGVVAASLAAAMLGFGLASAVNRRAGRGSVRDCRSRP